MAWSTKNKIACRFSLKAQACHQYRAGIAEGIAYAVSFCAIVAFRALCRANLQMEGLSGGASVTQTLRCCKLLRTDAEKQMGSVVGQWQFASLLMWCEIGL